MPTSRLSARTTLFVAVWLTASVYAWTHLDRGWVPHDEGTLAFSAERVMSGMLPHVDYDEVYTGGLAFAGAVAFRALGVDIFTLRLLLFAAFVTWIPVVYWTARHFATPLLAGLVTLLAGAWSIPAYSAAMPSWFNLFFAGFAVACLLRYLESTKRRWLVGAGLAAGLSILIKIVGLYLVAGCLLALAFFERSGVEDRVGDEESGNRLFSILITLASGLLVALVWSVAGKASGNEVWVHFILPAATLCAWLVITEWKLPRTGASFRLKRTTSLFLPFLIGVALPVLAFLIPYAFRGGLAELYRGLFVDPSLRFEYATRRPPHLRTLVTIIPLLLLLGVSWGQPHKIRVRIAGLLSALGVLLMILGGGIRIYANVWFSMRNLTPAVILSGIGVLWAVASGRSRAQKALHSRTGGPSRLRELQLLTLLSVTCLVSLVQFPFHAPVYFLYVAPLVALTALAVMAAADREVSFAQGPGREPGLLGIRPRPVLGVVFGFYLGFAVFWIHPGFIYHMGRTFVEDRQTEEFGLERASIRVTEEDKQVYTALVNELRRRAQSDFILATPDAPEVYFLTGLSSPTRSTFEFFDSGDPAGDDLLTAIDSLGVSVIALNEEPSFSPATNPELLAELMSRFPEERRIGRFLLRWRP